MLFTQEVAFLLMTTFLLIPFDSWDCYDFESNLSLLLLIKKKFNDAL